MAKCIANKVSSSEELLVLYEGQEKSEFWKQIGGLTDYKTYKNTYKQPLFSVRLFHCWNSANILKTEEIMNFQQNDLLSEDIMLLDVLHTIYVWVGNLVKSEDKNQALEIATEYMKKNENDRYLKTPIFVIAEGYEPISFIGFFENWDYQRHEKQKSFDELRKELEKQNPILHIELKSTDENYNFDTCEKFPLEKLLVKNIDELPFGVDPSHRELHLTEEEFYAIFGMKYVDFSRLARWKRDNMKKAVGLF